MKIGAGSLSIFSSNTFTGPVSVNQGTLNIRTATSLGTAASGTTVAAGATLELDAFGTTFLMTEPLTVAGTLAVPNNPVTNNGPVTVSSTNATFNVTVSNSRLEISGDLLSGVTGAGLTKIGSGTLGLQGSSHERTTIVQGTVLINGAQPSNQVTLAGFSSTAVLGGTGTLGTVTATSIAQITPGNNGPGILTCSNVAMTNMHFVAELNGTTPGAGHDQLNVRGTVALAGSNNLKTRQT